MTDKSEPVAQARLTIAPQKWYYKNASKYLGGYSNGHDDVD
ncbi:hypothetical protein SAMN05421799_104218 [Alicyclobacillus vulcanalis]|uniref:Uncharacterized protein n=1 Tax=Alicyclobacillus vulcanalis TaxID=252246 RepID=A0A1N7M4B7_9BACL|nr:hypothetical protein SAMN05421799_104218 [Alicyclobacillus vulcanalis]